tara:strand:- start:59 stop:229 length:171 start_codon:yes stop_codon:yes gene_type:complete
MKDNLSWKTIFWILGISIVIGLAVGKYLATVYIPSGSHVTTPSFTDTYIIKDVEKY